MERRNIPVLRSVDNKFSPSRKHSKVRNGLGIIGGLLVDNILEVGEIENEIFDPHQLINISLSRYQVLGWPGESKVSLRIRNDRVTSQGKPFGFSLVSGYPAFPFSGLPFQSHPLGFSFQFRRAWWETGAEFPPAWRTAMAAEE